MSIVFFGTPEFAVPSLKALLENGESVSLVVTQTDKLKGRGHKLTPPPVKIAALEAGLAVVQPVMLKDETFSRELASLKPEFIVVVAYGKILAKPVLDIPQYGCINVHASLLPKYRGAAPISWAVINGEEKTGVTTMLMDEGLDTGPALLTREIAIDREDTAGTLSDKLSRLGSSLLIETLKGLRYGSVKPIRQGGEPSSAPQLRKENGRIDWSKSAGEIFNFVRGMQPWPGASCRIHGETIRILKTEPLPGGASPGVIDKVTTKELVIGAGKGLLSIIELQPPGKKPMSASSFLQGRKLIKGQAIQ